MRASTIIVLGAAGLAAAAPASAPSCKNSNSGDDSTSTQTYGSFFVNKFVFGCTAGCYYTFDINFTTTNEQFECSGSLEDKDYVECKAAGDSTGESYSAYIDTTSGKNLLKLQYTVSNYPDEGTTTHWYGEDRVYAATSADADKQEANFSVDATSMTAVA
jgi:hypothetical protein